MIRKLLYIEIYKWTN